MSSTSISEPRFEALLYQNLEQFAEAFRLENLPGLRPILNHIFLPHARQITNTIIQYDQHIKHHGLGTGSQWLLDTFSTTVKAYGTEQIPQDRPLLVVSNHPGMTDAMAIFATLGRADIYAVGERNPILNLLPGVRQHVVFVKKNSASSIQAVRQIIQLLKNGNTVVLFPAGKIEPDPALHSTASRTLASWSRSTALLTKYVPDLCVLPVAVGGVISRAATQHPLTKLYRTQERRDWVAATLMMMHKPYRDVTVSVRYGYPIQSNPQMIQSLVSSQMTDLLAACLPSDDQIKTKYQ